MRFHVSFLYVILCLMILEAKKHANVESTAKLGQFPFMAQIARIVDGNASHSVFNNICGASLISTKWVLTSGQCFPLAPKEMKEVASNNSLIVIMGSIKNLDFTSATSRRFIVKIVRHPEFQDIVTGNMESVSDDIAVAKVNKDFALNKYIQTVALASPSFLHGQEIVEEINTCTVMGFGETVNNDRSGGYKTLLTYNAVKLVTSVKFGIPITANVFVSATKPNDVKNHGDIGSPVICLDVQFGLVSALVTIDDTYVDMYTQVEHYESFIRKNVPDVVFRVPQLPQRSGSQTFFQRKIGDHLQKIFSAVVISLFYVQYR